jgi:hypothetical protein
MKMSDPTQSPEAASWIAAILYKLLPAAVGAAIMVAVSLPQTKAEWFKRIFVALACSLIFCDFTFDLLKSFALFAFLDHGKKAHVSAVAGLIGASAWFVMGGAAMWLKRFRADPMAAVRGARKV